MIKLGGLISRSAFGITEASQDDKYTHIGYGKFKEKGKEKDTNAQTFKKDGDKYVPTGNDKVKGGDDSPDETKPKVNIFDKPEQGDATQQTSTDFGKDKEPDGDTDNADREIPSTKLKDIMPQSDDRTFSGQSDIGKIDKKEQRIISMKIDKLAEMAQEARAAGKDAPNYNLCKVTIPGTNLYCDGNLGIPRADMPQFKGKPQPGTPASKLPTTENGEVDTEPMFKVMLKKRNIKTALTEIPSDALKATQSELVGTKVAGMTKALEKNPNNPGITAPIYVSRDGYVIDGHHRWAAITSMAIKQGKPANMKVIVLDMDSKDVIPMANKFAEDMGIAAKKAAVKEVSEVISESVKARFAVMANIKK